MTMIEISIPHDFSTLPGGRFRHAGPDSGEELRQAHLEPRFRRARRSNQKLRVHLDGACYGYPIGFLEEAFGGLARQFGPDAVLETLDLVYIDDSETVRTIRNLILAVPNDSPAARR